jgi:hypothetical protein
MDFSLFLDHAVAGVPLLFVVLGIVEWFKGFKNSAGNQLFQGNDLLILSMFWGLCVGGCYMLSQVRPPGGDWWVGFVYWFALVFYGIALGLVASGLYDTIKGIVEKILSNKTI